MDFKKHPSLFGDPAIIYQLIDFLSQPAVPGICEILRARAQELEAAWTLPKWALNQSTYPLSMLIDSNADEVLEAMDRLLKTTQTADASLTVVNKVLDGLTINPDEAELLEKELALTIKPSLSSYARHMIVSAIWNSSELRHSIEEHRTAGNKNIEKLK
jgi:hypothetical protein